MPRPKRSRTALPPELVDANAAEDQAVIPLLRARGTAVSIETAIEQFLTSREQGLAERTPVVYRKVLRLLAAHLATRGQSAVWEVSADDLESWFYALRERRDERSGKPLAAATIANYARHVLACWHWFEARGLVPPHTTAALHVPSIPVDERREPTTFTDEEVERLFATAALDGDGPGEQQALAIRNRAMLAVLLESGVRCSEFVSMRVETIDWEQLAIRIHHSKTKVRLVDIGREQAPRMLRRYVQVARPWLAEVSEDPDIVAGDESHAARGALWLGRDGKALTQMGLEKFFQRLHRRYVESFEELTHSQCSPQVCRRWYITRSLLNGVPPPLVAEQCGTSLDVIMKFYWSANIQHRLAVVKHGAPLDALAREQALKQQQRGGRVRRARWLADPEA